MDVFTELSQLRKAILEIFALLDVHSSRSMKHFCFVFKDVFILFLPCCGPFGSWFFHGSWKGRESWFKMNCSFSLLQSRLRCWCDYILLVMCRGSSGFLYVSIDGVVPAGQTTKILSLLQPHRRTAFPAAIPWNQVPDSFSHRHHDARSPMWLHCSFPLFRGPLGW